MPRFGSILLPSLTKPAPLRAWPLQAYTLLQIEPYYWYREKRRPTTYVVRMIGGRRPDAISPVPAYGRLETCSRAQPAKKGKTKLKLLSVIAKICPPGPLSRSADLAGACTTTHKVKKDSQSIGSQFSRCLAFAFSRDELFWLGREGRRGDGIN